MVSTQAHQFIIRVCSKKKAKPTKKFSNWSCFQITAESRYSQKNKPQRLIFKSESRYLRALFKQVGAVNGYTKATTGANAKRCTDEESGEKDVSQNNNNKNPILLSLR